MAPTQAMDQSQARGPQHGRTRIVRDTFYKRYGIFYEPNEVWKSDNSA